ncbi:MAG TPA: hypothetical protein VHC49_24590 [Mycobacteriales bacterium]|nr:hypothetical protein [Mycobacteriales bacterium]
MTALQIRNVPEDVRRTLTERAQARGQSLQAFLLTLVEQEARRSRNLAVLDRFTDRGDGSRLTRREATRAALQARNDRDARGTS